MLSDPSRRSKLLDLLRPPDGYQLDEAIGTTYSLDLPALLVAPLAFTLFESEDEKGQLRLQSLEVLESVRQFSRKITLFCQSGRILAPTARFPMFAYLEKMVIECTRNGGSFHPKVWVLRFTGPSTMYRILCLSRNLTFDMSWDTALSLEGTLKDRTRAIGASRPLADFVAALPGFAVTGVDETTRSRVARMADELRRVQFEVPGDFKEFAFHPLGIGGYEEVPFVPDRRMLVVAPFLSIGQLEELFAGRPDGVLISSDRALNELTRRPAGIKRFFTLADAASPEPDIEDETAPRVERRDCDLHAKLYVIDDGWNTRIFTGSANATHAAFHRNVEFVVELTGLRSRFGIDTLLDGKDGEPPFSSLLRELENFQPACVEDPELAAIEKKIEDARSVLVAAPLHFRCNSNENDAARYDLAVEWPAPGGLVPNGVEVACFPVTLREEYARALSQEVPVSFPNLSLLDITRFLELRLSAGQGDRRRVERFVRHLPMLGEPDGREEKVLHSLLVNKKEFINYLLLLLADEGSNGAGSESVDGQVEGAAGMGFTTPAILETLLRALDRAPARLDHVHRLVTDLRSKPDAAELLPAGFDAVWDPIWRARLERATDE